MMHILSFNLLLLFGAPLHVACVDIFAPIRFVQNLILGPPAPAAEKSSLILAVESVETSKPNRCYLANNEFVTNHMNEIYRKFLFACPPEPDSEQADINETYSKTKNALFIEETYYRPRTPGKKLEYVTHKCRMPVKPSIINIGPYESDPKADRYLVGYEVFLGEDIKSYKIDPYNTAGLKDKRFAWFHAYTIAFNRKNGDVLCVFNHTLLASKGDRESEIISIKAPSKEAQVDQTDLIFDEGMFYDEDFDIGGFYGKMNQESVFRNLFGDSAPINYVDPIQNRYLGEVHLAPVYSFGIPLLRQAAQTFGNIAPMWNMVYEKAWKKVEKHLEYLAKGVKSIQVVTGTYGTLKISNKEVFLGPDKTVKVPAAFWKIVSYFRKKTEIYNVLIVTSNNPYDKNDHVNDVICKQNLCGKLGWQDIQQDFFAMGRTSCCELTVKVLSKLRMNHYEKVVDKTLNLKAIPHWRINGLTLNTGQYIMNQMTGVELDKPADDGIYRNKSNVEDENDREDEALTFSKFASLVYEIWIQPFFATKKDGAGAEIPDDATVAAKI